MACLTKARLFFGFFIQLNILHDKTNENGMDKYDGALSYFVAQPLAAITNK